MEKLRYHRERKSYSFQKMANLLGISKTYYWQIEKKKRRLTYEMAIKIANIFSKKPDEIFYDEFIEKIKKEN